MTIIKKIFILLSFSIFLFSTIYANNTGDKLSKYQKAIIELYKQGNYSSGYLTFSGTTLKNSLQYFLNLIGKNKVIIDGLSNKEINQIYLYKLLNFQNITIMSSNQYYNQLMNYVSYDSYQYAMKMYKILSEYNGTFNQKLYNRFETAGLNVYGLSTLYLPGLILTREGGIWFNGIHPVINYNGGAFQIYVYCKTIYGDNDGKYYITEITTGIPKNIISSKYKYLFYRPFQSANKHITSVSDKICLGVSSNKMYDSSLSDSDLRKLGEYLFGILSKNKDLENYYLNVKNIVSSDDEFYQFVGEDFIGKMQLLNGISFIYNKGLYKGSNSMYKNILFGSRYIKGIKDILDRIYRIQINSSDYNLFVNDVTNILNNYNVGSGGLYETKLKNNVNKKDYINLVINNIFGYVAYKYNGAGNTAKYWIFNDYSSSLQKNSGIFIYNKPYYAIFGKIIYDGSSIIKPSLQDGMYIVFQKLLKESNEKIFSEILSPTLLKIISQMNKLGFYQKNQIKLYDFFYDNSY